SPSSKNNTCTPPALRAASHTEETDVNATQAYDIPYTAEPIQTPWIYVGPRREK
ncbi:Envelope glycoprotein gp130, partial [Dissostichus eleginoides]